MNSKPKGHLRTILIWINRISAVVVAAGIALILADSRIHVTTAKGSYSFMSTPYEREDVSFEETELFYDILEEQIEEVVRISVIRNQLETNGEYDAKKEIDISAYANRMEPVQSNEVTAIYYLDDLIKWANYGFEYQTINSLYGEKQVLVSRYKTVEGKDLSYYAETDEEYELLIENLQETANSLFANYTEYVQNMEQYVEGDTNLFYCFKMVGDSDISYYTNMSNPFEELSSDDITELFTKNNMFLAYNPDKTQIATNMELNAKNMREILSNYEYAFHDNSRIWISINEAYPFEDSLKMAKDLYEMPGDNFFVISLISNIMLIFWVGSLGILTAKEGKNKKEEVPKQKLFFTEVYIGLYILFVVAMVYSVRGVVYTFRLTGFENPFWIVVMAFLAFVADFFFLKLHLYGIKKVREKTLLKDSLIVKLCQKIVDGFVETYDNGELVARTWLPYLMFLLINLILVLLGLGGIIAALFFDIGVGIHLYNKNKERQQIIEGVLNLHQGNFDKKIDTTSLHGDNLEMATAVNGIGVSIKKAVDTSTKDEKMKADLITNVSHDIKTPLTSIINYVDLLKREKIEDEKIAGYIQVLDTKSQRLKQLTDDLVEASKISSGNIALELERINLIELINQSYGEFMDKFEEKNLTVLMNMPKEPVFIEADSRHIYRVIENLYNNIFKYALEGTRVYFDMEVTEDDKVSFALKNISSQVLNNGGEYLTERFVRGDVSRKTEGSGLGLSIAKNLIIAMGGEFKVMLDGDLFKVVILFDKA